MVDSDTSTDIGPEKLDGFKRYGAQTKAPHAGKFAPALALQDWPERTLASAGGKDQFPQISRLVSLVVKFRTG